MRLQALQLQHYRSFEDSGRLVFGDRINVFVGKNDSGKSTVLESLRHFIYGQTQATAADDDIYMNAGEFDILFDAILDSRAEIMNGGENFSENKTVHFHCHHQRGQNRYQFELTQDGGQGITPTNPDGILAYRRPSAPIIAIDSLRNLKVSSGIGLDTFSQLPNNGANAASVVDDIWTSAGPEREEFVTIMKHLLDYEIGVVNAQGNTKSIGKTAGDKRIRADKMGSGVSEVAFLVATMLISKRQIIIVDEIENSIHPQLLKRLLNVIQDKSAERDLQFLIGTHSNIVLTQLGGLPGSSVLEYRSAEIKAQYNPYLHRANVSISLQNWVMNCLTYNYIMGSY